MRLPALTLLSLLPRSRRTQKFFCREQILFVMCCVYSFLVRWGLHLAAFSKTSRASYRCCLFLSLPSAFRLVLFASHFHFMLFSYIYKLVEGRSIAVRCQNLKTSSVALCQRKHVSAALALERRLNNQNPPVIQNSFYTEV